MKRHHKLIVLGLVLFLAGWLSWSALLLESEMPAPPPEVPSGN
jgi:hypothetical protein